LNPLEPVLANLPRLPINADGPVFEEPWQAQAFALTVRLHAEGAFTWPEWARALTAEIKTAEARGEADVGSRYYEHWLSALEHLTTARGLLTRRALNERKAAWARAYARTPHGRPVEL
jgi:nitrile hydratase accessory protein